MEQIDPAAGREERAAEAEGRTASSEPSSSREPRWWQRVIPVTAIAAVALTLLAVAMPGLDDDIELSTSRQAQPFVELYLTQKPAALCAGDTVRLRVRVQSHLPRVRTLDYRVAVDPAGPREETTRERGSVRIAPEQVKNVKVQVAAPAGEAFDLTVRLQGRPEHLRVHCGGGAR